MDPESAETDAAWWVFSQGCFREMLQVLGFEVDYVSWQKHLCTGRDPAGEEECIDYGGPPHAIKSVLA
jgi:hypothetical protein